MSPLVKAYGSRKVTFASGLLFGTGIALAAVAPNVPLFCTLYGGLTGNTYNIYKNTILDLFSIWVIIRTESIIMEQFSTNAEINI